MKRLFRILLNTATLLSLLLCLGAAGEWVFNRQSDHGVVIAAPSGDALVVYRPIGLYVAVGRRLRPFISGDEVYGFRPPGWGWQWRNQQASRQGPPDFRYFTGF